MPKTIHTVKLVCLASKDHHEPIAGLVGQLGKTLTLIEAKCWLECHVHDPNAPVILVLPEKYANIDQIIKAILATPLSNYLVITLLPPHL
jgi:hypothetical protein